MKFLTLKITTVGGTTTNLRTALLSTPLLKLNDLFWTLQGEGFHTGRRALFVRLPFCNYDCPWCDTEFNSYKDWTEKEFIDFLKKEPARFAVITGGEPLVNKQLARIIELLKQHNFYIACETNGSAPAPAEIDFVTTSPKAYTKGNHEPYFIDPQILYSTSEWKYVVDENFDFDLLKRHQPYQNNTHYSLSPEYNTIKKSLNRILSFIAQNPHWKLSLQTHKWINIP